MGVFEVRGVEVTDLDWLVEGNVVAAMVAHSNTVHAAVVHPIPEMRAYTMTALCMRYRKANGARPVKYERGDTPHLDRKLDSSFPTWRAGLGPHRSRRVCKWCCSVWDDDAASVAAAVDVPDDASSIVGDL